MVHLSVELTNSILDSEEPAVRASDVALAGSREPDALPVPQAPDGGILAPVCAACWAY
jgi:hypothetical protein